jgi:hypothetical protein
LVLNYYWNQYDMTEYLCVLLKWKNERKIAKKSTIKTVFVTMKHATFWICLRRCSILWTLSLRPNGSACVCTCVFDAPVRQIKNIHTSHPTPYLGKFVGNSDYPICEINCTLLLYFVVSSRIWCELFLETYFPGIDDMTANIRFPYVGRLIQ